MAAKEIPSQHDLMPLELATRVICERVYRPALACSPEQLNGIAYAVAALVPLFAWDADGKSVRRLEPEEIARGLFREGGRSLIFPDGRAALRPLAVRASGVNEVAQALARHDGGG